MEFERAIYRVYERCLEGLHEEDADENAAINNKSCKLFEYLCLGAATFFLVALIILHFSFVGITFYVLFTLLLLYSLLSLTR